MEVTTTIAVPTPIRRIAMTNTCSQSSTSYQSEQWHQYATNITILPEAAATTATTNTTLAATTAMTMPITATTTKTTSPKTTTTTCEDDEDDRDLQRRRGRRRRRRRRCRGEGDGDACDDVNDDLLPYFNFVLIDCDTTSLLHISPNTTTTTTPVQGPGSEGNANLRGCCMVGFCVCFCRGLGIFH